MPDLIPFHFQSQTISVIKDIHDEPWWVAAEICAILGLENVSKAVSRLDDDEKQLIAMQGVENSSNAFHSELKMLIINEPGLYSLILSSRKPEAKVFKRWVTHEVLPALRRTGAYVMPSQTTAIDARLVTLQKHIKQLTTDVAALKRRATNTKTVPRCVDCHMTISRKDWAVERLRKNRLCNTCCEVRFMAFRRTHKL